MSLQQEIIQKLGALIMGFPKFGEEDKKEWLKYIELLPPEYALFVLELFEQSPDDILKLHDNLKAKRRIIAERNKAAWQELLSQEKQSLEEAAKM